MQQVAYLALKGGPEKVLADIGSGNVRRSAAGMPKLHIAHEAVKRVAPCRSLSTGIEAKAPAALALRRLHRDAAGPVRRRICP